MLFSENLRKCRLSANLTQKEAGEAVGLSMRQWQDYEAGKRTPTFDRLLQIADYFGVSVDYLVGREKTSIGENSGVSDMVSRLEDILPPPHNCKAYSFVGEWIERERDAVTKTDTVSTNRLFELDLCSAIVQELVNFYTLKRDKKCYDKIEDVEEDYLALLESGEYRGGKLRIYEAIRELARYERPNGPLSLRKKMSDILFEAITILLTDETGEDRQRRYDKERKIIGFDDGSKG